jgi:hypothetical protein
MSWVANVLLSHDILEDEALVREFSEWLDRDEPRRALSGPPNATGVGFLVPLTGDETKWGGHKRPECHVWGGVLNHADLTAVVEKFGQMGWKHPGSVQLLLVDQEESFFRIWMIRNGEPHQFAPEPDPNDDGCS